MRRKFLSLSLTLLMSFLYLIPQAALAEGVPSFTLTLNNTQVTVGNEVQVTVTGHNLIDIYAFDLNLDFDHTALEFKEITSGISGFSVDPMVDGDHLRFANTKLYKVAGESGTQNLAIATFKAINQGNPAIRLKSVELVDSQLASQLINSNVQVTASIISSGGIGVGNGSGNGNGNGNHSNTGGASGSLIDNANDSQSVQLGLEGKVIITPDVIMDTATKTALSVVNAATWEKAVQQATSNESGIKNIQIQIKEVPGAAAYVQKFPTKTLSNIGTSFQIEIVSPLASVIIPNNMFHTGELTSEEVELRIGKADVSKLGKEILDQIGNRPVIDISLQADNNTISWSNPDAPVRVSIPYSPNAEELLNPEHIVVWYLSGEGQVVTVPNGRYDVKTGTVIFTTTHFSIYAITFVQKSFDDIGSLDWAKNQIEVLASKGIINGISDKSFEPGQPVSRADFLVLLVRTLELNRSKGLGVKFADVYEDDYYDEALRIARKAGITEGVGNNLFKPHDSITREDMIVMTERALRVTKQMTSKTKEGYVKQFSDYAQISDYALSSVVALVDMGLVQGYDNAIHPKETTNRAQAAVLMYNIYSNLK